MPRLVLTVLLASVVVTACGERIPGNGAPASTDSTAVTPRMVPAVLSGAGDAGNEELPTCIRGGTSREDVRRIMGEPDSVSFGAWLYGASEIQFGYGVVVETRDPDGRLPLCD